MLFVFSGTGVVTMNLHPGLTLTDIGRHFGKDQARITRSLLYPFWMLVMKTPEQGVQTILHCALDEDAYLFNGEYFE